jgi:hypothetical protein
MKTLALDVSGASTGWALGEDTNLVAWGKYVSPLGKRRGFRLYEFGKWLEGLLEEHRPDIVLVEKPFLGRNSKVLANLSKFVAIVEYKVFHVLGLEIQDDWFLDPRRIKKLLKVQKPSPKHNNSKSVHDDNKKIMLKKINGLYGLRLKYAKGRSKKYNDDDISDAIALWHAWLIIRGDKEK